MKVIILNGPPGAGKSTTAKALADRLGISFLNIDMFYSTTPRYDLSVEWHKDERYKQESYDKFESKILEELNNKKDVVLETSGTGGKWNSVIAGIKEQGHNTITVLLKISLEMANERVKLRNESEYPLKVTKEVVNFLWDRTQKEVIPDITLDASQDTEILVNSIIDYTKPTDLD